MKKTLNKLITVLLVLTMLFGVVSTTALAAPASESSDSKSQSTTQSGGIDAGWCEISYDENGVTLVLNPDVKSLLYMTKDDIKDLVQTVIQAAKVVAVDKLKDSIIGELTPSAPGSSNDAAGQSKLQGLCETAITAYVNEKYGNSEKNAYVAFVEALLADSNAINSFVDYAIGSVKDAIALGIVQVESLPDAEAISVDMIINLFEIVLNEKIRAEVDSCVTSYLAWLEDNSVAINSWANSFVDAKIKSYVKNTVNAYINAGFTAPTQQTIDVIVAEYLNGEISSMVTSWVDAYASGAALDSGVKNIIDGVVNEWAADVADAYPQAANNPIGEYALNYINTIIDSKVSGYVNEYLSTGVISDGKVDVAKIEGVLKADGASFIYESYWANKKAGFDFSTDEFWSNIHTGLRTVAEYFGVSNEAYDSTDADALRAQLEANDFATQADIQLAALIESYTYSDWASVWNKLTAAQREIALATVEAAFNFQDETVKSFISEYWSSASNAEENRREVIAAIPAAKLAAAIDLVIADAKENNVDLIKSEIDAYISSSTNPNVVVDTLRDLLAFYKQNDAAKYEDVKTALKNYAVDYANGDQVFEDVFGVSKDTFLNNVKTVYAPAFIAKYEIALAEIKAAPEITLGYKDFIKYVLKYLSYVSINGKKIYSDSSVDLGAVKSLVTDLPRPNEIANMSNEEMFLSYDIVLATSFGEIAFNLTARLGGGYEVVRKLARVIAEHIDFYISDEGVITLNVRVPAKFAELVVRAIDSEKVPETLKKKVFAAFSKTPDDAYALMNSVSLDDLLQLFNYIDVDRIINKLLTYDFISRFERLEGLSEEKIKNKIKEYEDYYKLLISYANRIYNNRIPDRFKDNTLIDLYDGNGKFSYSGTHSVDVEAILNRISSKYGPLVSAFFNLSTITASVDLSIEFEKVGQVTYVVGGKVYREGFLPAGADLQYFAGITSYAGEPIIGWLGDDGVLYTKMPAKDVVLTAQFDIPEILPPEVEVSPDVETAYDGKGVTISAEIVGGVPENTTVAYQWYYIPATSMFSLRLRPGAILIQGATDSTYTVVNAYDSGDYFCEITLTDLNGNQMVVVTDPVNVTITSVTPDYVGPTANTGLVYNGLAQELIIPGTTSGGQYIYKLEGGVYSTEIPTAIAAGTYTVYYMVEGDGNYDDVAESSFTVTIAKADAEFTSPAAKQNLVYNTQLQTLVSAGSVSVGTIYYKLGDGEYTTELPAAINAGTYTVYYKVELSDNYNAIESGSFTVTIAKADATFTAPTAVSGLVYNGNAQTLVSAGSVSVGTIYYKLGDGEYTTELPTATNAGTYTVYYKVEIDDNYNAIEDGSFTVTIAKADAAFTAPSAASGLVYNGNAQTLVESGSVSAGTILYKLDDGQFTTELPTATNAGSYVVYYKVELDDNYNAIEGGYFTVAIAKADAEFTAPEAAEGLVYDANAKTLVVAGTVSVGTILYKLEGGEFATELPTATNAGSYVVYYKVELDDNYNAIEGGSFTVTVEKATPSVTAPVAVSGLVYNTNALTLITAGATTGGTIYYKLDNGEYTTELPTATGAGTYTVYYKVVGDANYKDVAEASITVTIDKAVPVVTAPVGNTGLTYNALVQTLISAGATSAGTIYYKVGNGEYTTELPTATGAGTYTVYYKVVGNANYYDVAEESFTVTIAKVVIDPSLYTWRPESFVYDGTLKAVYLFDSEGNKLEFGISYTGNTATTHGTYVASVTVDYDNFELAGDAVFVDFSWTIAKAVYDMSGITFTDKVVDYDGLEHVLEITGTLPNGVSVQYTENAFTAPGTYTVTAYFTGDENYEAIPEMTATLTIKEAQIEIVTKNDFSVSDSEGNVIVSVNAANGIPETYELMVKDLSAQYNYFESNDIFGKGKVGYAKGVYDIYFAEGGITQSVSDTFTVKIALPVAAKSATGTLKVVYVAENGEISEVSARVEGDYMVFETTHFSVYAIVAVGDAPVEVVPVDLSWLWTVLVIIAILAIAIFLFFLKKQKDGETDDSNAAPAPVAPAPASEPAAEEPAAEEPAAEEPAAEEPATEEPAAEEPAAEEPAAEEPAVEEPAVEEPAPVEEPVEEKPVVAPILDAETAAKSFNLDEIVGVRFRTSFMSRLIQAEEELQGYYSEIKNKLLSYKGVKARTSWNFESFNKGRIQCAKLNIKGNALQVYLALDPNEYNVNKYHFTNVGDKPKLDQVPMLLKVKSERALKYALELIEEMMTKLGMVPGKNADVDYRMPYETTEALVARDLVKVILPAGVTLDGDENLFRINVGALLETVKTDEVAEEPVASEPVVEESVPAVEEPVVEETAVEEPVAEEPVVEETAVEEPVVEETAVEEPAVEETVVEEPAVEEPAVEEPVVEEPAVEEPAVEEPVVEEIVHVDAVHADMIISDEEAKAKIEILEKDASEAQSGNKMVEINLDTICENFEDGDVVTLSALKAKRLVNKNAGRIKVLARGVMTKKLTVCADKFSLQAVKMITLAGGHADQYK